MKAPKQERCFALLIMVIIAISTIMMTMPVAALDGDVTFDLTMYFSSTSGIILGVAPGGYVIVDVWVDTGVLTGLEGIHAWGLYVTVDPTVLTPVGAYGGDATYFLYEWSIATYPFPGFPPTFISSYGTDYIECSETFLPLPPEGATGTGRLCTLYFKSESLTDYTELTIDVANSFYQDPTGAQYLINPVHGHYNKPIFYYLFEQWSGSTFPTGDPTGSDWHELEPNLCDGWTMESWDDNGDGILSPSDQIHMFQIDPPDPNIYWFHVEWVSPVPVAGDGVGDLLVTSIYLVPPSASFTFSPAEPIVGETVTFDASASTDSDGTIVSYAWDFGDGASGSGVVVEHVYTAVGKYTVALTVTDNDGIPDTASKSIKCAPPAVPEFPLGAEAAAGMGFMIVVAYVWLRNRRKTKPTGAKRFTT